MSDSLTGVLFRLNMTAEAMDFLNRRMEVVSRWEVFDGDDVKHVADVFLANNLCEEEDVVDVIQEMGMVRGRYTYSEMRKFVQSMAMRCDL